MIHYLKNIPLEGKMPENLVEIVFGAGCFWGIEKKFWDLPGIYVTSVGYSGGDTENPTYEDVCYNNTHHVEVVKVIYDPVIINIKTLLKIFWECHDPTQGMRQGNDLGSQYRSVIFFNLDSHKDEILLSLETYQDELELNGYGSITTEISMMQNYFLAEEYHQQYLAKNPNGYCGLGGTGCSFPNN